MKLQANEYSICKNGCMLYNDNDKETKFCKNEDCKEARFTLDGAPVRKMKMSSLAKITSLWLANDKTRDLMQYRYKYKCILHVPLVY